MKKGSPFERIVITLFLFFTCCVVILISYFVFNLPDITTKTFGTPAPHLSTTQRLLLSVRLLWQADKLINPANTQSSPVEFEISLGEPLSSIATRLENTGIISSRQAFLTYLIYSGQDITLQAGNYTLDPGLNALEIAKSFQDATPDEISFIILAGWRLEEIATTLPSSGLEISPEDLITAAKLHPAGYAVLKDLPQEAALEGFFFPGTYQIPRKLTAPELVQVVLDHFASHITPEMRQSYKKQGLNIYQAVTLASIVEREAILDDEMALIASVFLNRLVAGERLAADSTVQYALGYNAVQATWWTNPLIHQDFTIDSPYNTYLYPGLPPGPIANPGIIALQAVAFPAQTSYFYFRAACDNTGKHLFADTFNEHLANACP